MHVRKTSGGLPRERDYTGGECIQGNEQSVSLRGCGIYTHSRWRSIDIHFDTAL